MTDRPSPTPTDDLIDSREVIDILENLRDAGGTNEALAWLAEQGEGLPDWEFGVTLVRDSYFETYAQELAEDIGSIPENAPWPLTCIDWAQAARELQMDYTPVEYAGVTYWAR